MNPTNIVQRLYKYGFRLTVVDDQLVMRNVFEDSLWQIVQENKDELLEWLLTTNEKIQQCEQSAELTQVTNPALSRARLRDAAQLRAIASGRCRCE